MSRPDAREELTRGAETDEHTSGRNRVANVKKLRATLLNFVKNERAIASNVSEEPDMEEIVKRWWQSMKGKYGGSWVLFLEKYFGVDEAIEMAEELYEKHEPFREACQEVWTYNENVGPSNGGGQDGEDELESAAKGLDYRSMDVGKLRGYMMAFLNNREKVKADVDVDLKVFAEKFDKWMIVRKAKERGAHSLSFKKLNEYSGGDMDYLQSVALEMYNAEGFPNFRNELDDKWTVADSSEDGEKAEEIQKGEKDSIGREPGILGYAEEFGVADRSDWRDRLGGNSTGSSTATERPTPTSPSAIESWAERVGKRDYAHENWSANVETDRIIQGDCKDVMLNELPRNCIDMIITSPPYWAVRDYEGDVDAQWDGGEWAGQLGHEPTPDLFVEHLMEVFRACGRVLKPSGTMWINIDDTYGGKSGGYWDSKNSLGSTGDRPSLDIGDSVKQKCQAAVPERLVLKMIEEGWYKRNTIIWAKQVLFEDDDVKGATKPSAVKDRFVEKAKEYLFMFSQKPNYYFDLDSVRRPHKTDPTAGQHYTEEAKMVQEQGQEGGSDLARDYDDASFYHEKGGNLPSAWQINPARSTDAHYAPFPERLVERPIKAGCPEGGVVLDPFLGTGTTCRVAAENNRHWIGIELSDEYVEIAKRNIPGSLQQKLV